MIWISALFWPSFQYRGTFIKSVMLQAICDIDLCNTQKHLAFIPVCYQNFLQKQNYLALFKLSTLTNFPEPYLFMQLYWFRCVTWVISLSCRSSDKFSFIRMHPHLLFIVEWHLMPSICILQFMPLNVSFKYFFLSRFLRWNEFL